MPAVLVILLTSFVLVAGISLWLLARLAIRGRTLDRANRELARRNDELHRAGEAKRRFVANLSHELRNPLNAVLGFSELLRDGRVGPVSDRQREHLQIIHDSADHILTLSDELLDVARIEAGRVRLAPEPLEPSKLAAACVNSLAGLAAARDVQVDLDPRPVGLVTLDPARLRQVILNYLSNALKFTPPGGRIRVNLARADDRLQVSVSDTGPGIEAGDQARVFDEFFQVSGTERLGTGLGLAVTRSIVEAQGGEVGVRSRPGTGSTFSASLPVGAGEVGALCADVQPATPPSPA
ncbi:MAG: HAMP domain-containing sensor histidine kinase, partial [Solirubrobacteraceae bacterium]